MMDHMSHTKLSGPETVNETNPQFDLELRQAFINAMAHIATPVSIVTAIEDGVPHGTTVSAFLSLSVDPPLALISLDRKSEILQIIERTGKVGLNVLDAEQSELATRFARKGEDRFAFAGWQLDAGLPRLAGGIAWLACDVDALVPAGDHILVVAAVRGVHAAAGPGALTYRLRQFGMHHPHN